MAILEDSFYKCDTVTVARALLGKQLVREVGGVRCVGTIVETEAYSSDNDPGSHAYRKKTARNAPMFGPVGHLYVYFVYGCYHCVNIVARKSNVAAGAVLIRALIPHEGSAFMRTQRKKGMSISTRKLTDGPGKLCQALQITKDLNGLSVTQKGALYVVDAVCPRAAKIIATPRVGISDGQHKLWRFCLVQKSREQ